MLAEPEQKTHSISLFGGKPDDQNAHAAFNQFSHIPDDIFLTLLTLKQPNVQGRYIQFESGPHIPSFKAGYWGRGYHGSFKIDFRGPVIAGYGSIESTLGDRITGRKCLGNNLAAAFAAGAERYIVFASSSMGGYVWANTGMAIEDGDIACTSALIRERLNILQPQMAYAEYKSLYEMAALKDKTALKHLARQEKPVRGVAGLFKRVSQVDSGCAEHDFAYYQANNFFKDGRVARGQFLLARLAYHAYADKSDADQIETLSKETGVPIMARLAAVS